jgi:hypothetical protein
MIVAVTHLRMNSDRCQLPWKRESVKILSDGIRVHSRIREQWERVHAGGLCRVRNRINARADSHLICRDSPPCSNTSDYIMLRASVVSDRSTTLVCSATSECRVSEIYHFLDSYFKGPSPVAAASSPAFTAG